MNASTATARSDIEQLDRRLSRAARLLSNTWPAFRETTWDADFGNITSIEDEGKVVTCFLGQSPEQTVQQFGRFPQHSLPPIPRTKEIMLTHLQCDAVCTYIHGVAEKLLRGLIFMRGLAITGQLMLVRS